MSFTGGSDGPVQGRIEDQFSQRRPSHPFFGRQDLINHSGQVHRPIEFVEGENRPEFFGREPAFSQSRLNFIGGAQVNLVNGGGLAIDPLGFPNIEIFVAFFQFFV